MAVRDDRSDVRQTTTGFRGPLMVQSLTSAKSKFLSLKLICHWFGFYVFLDGPGQRHFLVQQKVSTTSRQL